MNDKINKYCPEEAYNIIDINNDGIASIDEWFTLDAALKVDLEQALMENGMTISDCFIYNSDFITLQAEYSNPPLLPRLLPLINYFGTDNFDIKFKQIGNLLSQYSTEEIFNTLSNLDAVRQARVLVVLSYFKPDVYDQLDKRGERLIGFRYFDHIKYNNPDNADRYTSHLGLFAMLASLHDNVNTEALDCEHGEQGILPVTPTDTNLLGIWPNVYNSSTDEQRIIVLASAGCFVFDLDSYNTAKGTFHISSQMVYGLELPPEIKLALNDSDPAYGLDLLFSAFEKVGNLPQEVSCSISDLNYIDQARVLIALNEFDEGAYQEIRNSGQFPNAIAITEQLQINGNLSSYEYTFIAFASLANGKIGGFDPSQFVHNNKDYPFLRIGDTNYLVESYDPRSKSIVIIGLEDNERSIIKLSSISINNFCNSLSYNLLNTDNEELDNPTEQEPEDHQSILDGIKNAITNTDDIEEEQDK